MRIFWIFCFLFFTAHSGGLQADIIRLKSGLKLENVKTLTEGNYIIIIGKDKEIMRLKFNQIARRSLGPQKSPNYFLRSIAWPGWGEFKKDPDNPLGKRLMFSFGALALTWAYSAREHLGASRMHDDTSFHNMVNTGAFVFFPRNPGAALTLARGIGKNHYRPIENRKNHFALIGNSASLLMAVVYAWNLFRLGVFSGKGTLAGKDDSPGVFVRLSRNHSKRNYIVVGVKF